MPLAPAPEAKASRSEADQPDLASLAAALREGAALWRPRPFTGDPDWVAREPALATWCSSLSPAEVIAIERSEALPDAAPALLHDWQRRLAALTALPMLTVSTDSPPRRLVPARKATQIARFSDAVAAALPTPCHATEVVDWCGGKGHLGRNLGARLGLPVTVLERHAGYADEARALADDDGVALRFVAADAMARPITLQAQTIAVGLHACGELGLRLLEHAVDSVYMVALAPCCLHKIAGLHEHGYQPVSRAARAVDPGLDHSSLRLATAEEVVARPSLQAQRRRDNAWRQGLDHLLRSAGRDGYTPLGVLPEALKAATFEAFVDQARRLHDLALPTVWSPSETEAIGWRRAERARAFGLVRSLFKRTIEVFCALDRKAFLEEHGLAVTLGTFAPRAITPRNVLLIAHPKW